MATRGVGPRHHLLGGLAAAAIGLAQSIAPATAAADVGYRGPSFAGPAGVVDPSGQKPQSKLWFHDGSWWGSLFRPSTADYTIHRLDAATHRWLDTGTALDERNSSEADTLWDGRHLYVASGSDATPGIRLYRFSYSPLTKRYGPDPGFGFVLPGTGTTPVEAVVLDKAANGQLWVTYTKEGASVEDGKVYVAHTTAPNTDSAWGTPYVVPEPGASNVTADDISALVSYGGRIGVMWSNQNDDAMYFASHADGAGDGPDQWTSRAVLSGPRSADDHINLKSLQADPSGQVFAAVKTSLGDDPANGPAADQVLVLALAQDGGLRRVPFGRVSDDHTRPIVLTNRATRRLYVFATSPTSSGAGVQTIYYKETSLDSPSFLPGRGASFIQSSAGHDVNDPTSTKQDLAAAPGLVVLASDPTHYWHNVLGAGGAAPGGASPSSAPPSTSPSSTAGPAVGRLSLRPRAFRPARRGARLAASRGAKVTYTLSRRATGRFTVERAVRGKRVGRRCVRARRTNRGARPCRRYLPIRGSFSHAGGAGTNSFRFAGRVGRRRLARARYRLIMVATDAAGRRSAPRRVAFRIVR